MRMQAAPVLSYLRQVIEGSLEYLLPPTPFTPGNEWHRGRGGGLAKPSERIRNPSPWARMAGDGFPLLSGRLA